ncbi:signal transduction histidine kinase [Bacilli bacterium PM5-9]|nr:signal transduction histidine kinase [Bacilli bacterium PM5-9]
MNNKRSILWRRAFVVVVVLFCLTIVLSVYSITQLPQEYANKQNKQIELAKSLIDEGIETEDINKFNNIKSTYSVEFLVYDVNLSKIIYSTIPMSQETDLQQSLNRNAISYEEYYSVKKNNKKYNVWFVQYNISPQEVFDTWIVLLITIILLTIGFNILAIIIFYKELLKPIQRLKENIIKISKYQLDSINQKNDSFEYDQLSKRLAFFAQDLSNYLEKTNYSYTELEKNLQLKNEEMVYRTRMVASLTHNLKSPIVNENLYINEILKDSNDQYLINNNLNEIKLINQKLLNDINDIGELVYQDNTNMFLKNEEIDLIAILLDNYNKFIHQYKSKNYQVILDFDEKVIINTNKLSITQIIHNAFSNIYAYGKENGLVEISCYKENNKCYLSFYNDAKQFEEEQLENIFKLFYRISDNHDGLGTGLFTIKRLTAELGGDVSMKNKDNGIVLEFVFDDML